MPDAVTHPSLSILAAFSQGKLSEAEAATVAGHLETCPDCPRLVEQLPPDSFVGKVRAARPRTGTQLPSDARLQVPGPVADAQATPPANLPSELANHPKYRVVRELGRGGMGVVYEAIHTGMDRRIAIKVINPSVLEHPDALPRFQSEVKAAGKLDHENIVRAYDTESIGSLHLLVMEFVKGKNLADYVQQQGPLSIVQACHCVRQAALGLQHAFEQGMVHRDIKPHNLMVTAQGKLKILDFGLARVRGERAKGKGLTQADAFMGTPEYVSPEQATDARTADIRSDIYSLGCTLYFLLTDRPPFQEETVVKVVLAQIEKEPRPLHEVRPDVPEAMSAVVARMLAKDPAQRYQKPVEVAQALLPFLKPGAKTGSRAVPRPLGVNSPGRATKIGSDTSRMPRADNSGAELPAQREQQESPFADLDGVAESSKPRMEVPLKSRSGSRWRRPALFGGAAVVLVGVFLAGLWAGGVLSIGKTPRNATAPQSPNQDSGGNSKPPLPKEFTNSIDMKLVRIPAGKFVMGSPPDEEERDFNEGPRHEVEIKRPFYLGVFEVTQQQYQRVMGANPSSYLVHGPDTARYPVENVSWEEADEFCRKLSALVAEKTSGWDYRLPTEAEWEYACRGGAEGSLPFHFGRTLSSTQANFDGDHPYGGGAKGPYRGGPVPVGSYSANSFGLHDMHGNVCEWCQDFYDGEYYKHSPPQDPYCSFGDLGHVFRGGAFYNYGRSCRAAIRNRTGPSNRFNSLGFRVACVPHGQ